MLGAIIGDIAGSRFERNNYRAKDFELFTEDCRFTDDSVLSLAICDALLSCRGDYRDLGALAVQKMQEVGRCYPDCGYGGKFRHWLYLEHPEPYNSCGNGSAMRVSGCGFAAASLEEAKELSLQVTRVTHNHPEGLKGAEATAASVYLLRSGFTKNQLREYLQVNYYPLDFTIAGLRSSYKFSATCQGSVPQALEAFLEARDFEDAIRTAISLGGDSDTIGAVAGSLAEACYGIPPDLRKQALTYLDQRLLGILKEFEEKYPGQGGRKD